MRRLTALAAYAAVLVLGTWNGAAPGSKPEAPVKPKAKAEGGVTGWLSRRADFPGFDDPRVTLGEVLDSIAQRYDVSFDINEHAFRLDNVPDVLKTEIANPTAIPKMKNARLDTVLAKVLGRIPSPSGVTILLRREAIEITTGQFQRSEIWGENDRGPFLPLIHANLNKRPLDEALKELADQADCNILLDGRAAERGKTAVTARFNNTPLDTAVTLLADMAELRPVLVGNVLYVTTPEHAKALEGRLKEEKPGKEARKGKVLWLRIGISGRMVPLWCDEEDSRPLPVLNMLGEVGGKQVPWPLPVPPDPNK